MTSNMFSGPCFGDSTPSYSSPDAEKPISPTSSPLTLDSPIVQTEGLYDFSVSINQTNQIGANGSSASQGHFGPAASLDQPTSCQRTDLVLSEDDKRDEDNTDHDPRSNHASMLMLNPHCQQSLHDSSAVSIADMDCSIENHDSSSCSMFGLNGQQTSNLYEGNVSPSFLLDRGERMEAGTSHSSEHPDLLIPEKKNLKVLIGNQPTTMSHSLNLDFSQTAYTTAAHTRNPQNSPYGLNLRPPSSNSPISPRISDTINVENRLGSAHVSVESFKSTGGCHTDDILSRPPFPGEREIPTIHTNSRISISRGHYSSPSITPTLHSSNIAYALYEKGTQAPPEPMEHDPSSGHPSLTYASGSPEHSHELANTDALDHFKIPSSSPIAHAESSQKTPYFAPATIIRPDSSDFRTDVGTQELPSSSPPPSSPSMSSNYMPSSSPIPSSSPAGGSSQTPPTSPPKISDAYNPTMPTVGAQETFYTDVTHSAFPHYAMDTFYKPPDQEVEISYPSTLLQSSTSVAGSLASPFPMEYFRQVPEQPGAVDRHIQENLIMISPGPVYPTVEKVIPAAETTQADGDIHTQGDNPKPQTTQKNPIPYPKRSTLASQKAQHKKLSKPFRSPVLHAPVRLAPKPPMSDSSGPLMSSSNSILLKEHSGPSKTAPQPTSAVASSSSQTLDNKIKHRTPRASSQFKSPLSASSSGLDEADLVRLTPTIQSLERKLQLLRRALKVREDVQEEALDGLVKKWSDAGKEVAWEVWDLVKDNVSSDSVDTGKGKKRAIEESWGWDESIDKKKPRVEEKERNWGWDVVPVSEREEEGAPSEVDDAHIADEQQEEDAQEEEARRHSLGTMLMELGIAPETLGWNEEEGTFTDS